MEELDRLARDVVLAGVAPSAAVGSAGARGEPRRWEVSSGGATRGFFDLASLTKPMLALAVARSGLSKDMTIGDLVEETRDTPTSAATLELLLAHRAGLEAHIELPIEDAVRRAALARRERPEAAIYSDLGYVLAGVGLARYLGVEDAGVAIEQLVVAPLGLERELGTARSLAGRPVDFATRVLPTEVSGERGEIRGLVHDENAFRLTGTGGSGHAGMFGTVEAVLRFACAAHDAIELSKGPLAAGDLGWLTIPRPLGSHRAGFDSKSDEGSSAGTLAGPRTYGHLGFTGTSFWIDPDAQAIAVLLTNRVHPTRTNLLIRSERPRVHDALFAHALARR